VVCFKEYHAQGIGAAAGTAPDFYNLVFNMNLAEPDFFRVAMKTFMKEGELGDPVFALLRCRHRLLNRQSMPH